MEAIKGILAKEKKRRAMKTMEKRMSLLWNRANKM